MKLNEKRKLLAAKSLARKIGYLKLQLDLPTQDFNPHKIIRPKDELFVIQKGRVEIWHTRLDMLVTNLGENSVFGEMPLLGQTMLGCQAIAGSDGVSLGVMGLDQAMEWIGSTSLLSYKNSADALHNLKSNTTGYSSRQRIQDWPRFS